MMIGDYRTPVIIEHKPQTRNAMGTVTRGNWTELFTTWAKMEFVTGDEVVSANNVQSRPQYRFNIRYDARVTQAHRINMSDRLFNIVGMNNEDGKNAYLDLICRESFE